MRTIRLVTSIILLASGCWGAFHSNTEWDVKTTGADTNGGGFQAGATGTDYSQSNAPQWSYTDIVIGGTTTQGTSVLRPFSAVDPGNVINITAGANCTVQRVQIVSQAAGVATFDKSLGTAASTCTGALGGALATPTLAQSLAISGNTVHIQTGTYTVTATMTIVSGANGPGYIIGYQVNHRDGGTKPLITTATDSTPLYFGTLTNWVYLKNLSLSNTAAVRSTGLSDPGSGGASYYGYYVEDCIMDGFSRAFYASSSGRPTVSFINRTEIKNSTVNILQSYTGNTIILNSYIHNNTGTLALNVALTTLINDLIVANTGVGVTLTGSDLGSVFIHGNTIAGNSSHGISIANSTWNFVMENNILYGNGGWGAINSTTHRSVGVKTNAYGANKSGDLSGIAAGVGDVTLLADPFTASGSGDYSLNSTAGGGAALKGVGTQGTFPGGTTVGYQDIGTVQVQGGGGATIHGSAFVQ